MTRISVVIPTRNRASLLKTTLDSLILQTYPKDLFEVIVIDDGSTDNTRDVTSHAAAELPNIRYFHSSTPGLHEGRHQGLKESTADILAYADDDIEAFPTWLEGIAESFQSQKVGLVGGKDVPNYEVPPPSWLDRFWVNIPEGKFMTYFSLLDFGERSKVINPQYVFGCNFSIRKSIVIKAGGFHPDGMPPSMLKYRGDGETHVARKVEEMGYVAMYNPKASVKHWVPASRMNMDYLIKRAYAEGITQSYVNTRRRHFHSKHEFGIRHLLMTFKARVRYRFLSADEKKIEDSFNAGYRFHQQEVKTDRALFDWVTKDSYMPEKPT